MRPVNAAAAGLKAFEGRRIQELKPRDIAERKLKTSSKHYCDEEIAEYMKLFDEVLQKVKVDGGVA